MLKDQLFETSGLQFVNWPFGSVNFSDVLRNARLLWVEHVTTKHPVEAISYKLSENCVKRIFHTCLNTIWKYLSNGK